MSAAADAQETIRRMVQHQLEMARMKIDAALARIQQSQADIAVDRETVERQEKLILGWQRILGGLEKPA